MDIKVLMDALNRDRPIFFSEADFQHSLACLIHDHLDYRIRLEYPPYGDSSEHIDILCRNSIEDVAIELKYKPAILSARVKDELYSLKAHSAQDCGRYDFCLDIEKIESFLRKTEAKNARGYAIFLTNDKSYWEPSTRGSTICDDFRIHEGNEVFGHLSWGAKASQGTKGGRTKAIQLNHLYRLTWNEYSNLAADSLNSIERNSPSLFRYTVVEVKR